VFCDSVLVRFVSYINIPARAALKLGSLNLSHNDTIIQAVPREKVITMYNILVPTLQ